MRFAGLLLASAFAAQFLPEEPKEFIIVYIKGIQPYSKEHPTTRYSKLAYYADDGDDAFYMHRVLDTSLKETSFLESIVPIREFGRDIRSEVERIHDFIHKHKLPTCVYHSKMDPYQQDSVILYKEDAIDVWNNRVSLFAGPQFVEEWHIELYKELESMVLNLMDSIPLEGKTHRFDQDLIYTYDIFPDYYFHGSWAEVGISDTQFFGRKF